MRKLLLILAAAGLGACADNIAGPEATTAANTAPVFNTGTEGTIPGQYIVTVDDAADPAAVAATFGITAQHVYRHLVTGFAAQIPDFSLEALKADPRVRLVEADQTVMIDADVTTQSMHDGSGSWGLDRIDQRTLPLNKEYTYTHTGAGVRAYVIDTGIRFDHEEFEGRAVPGYDAYPADNLNSADCPTGSGHGTHVAGTVGGKSYGVAKEVSLVSVRVLSCAGSGSVSGIIAGMEWIAQNGKLPAVASMSIGSGIPTKSDAYDNAVRNLFNSGVLLVMSAGNGYSAAGVGTGVGYDSCLRSPSWIQVGITVGNSNSSDNKSTSSNYGDCVDLFAPGSSIVSAGNASPTAKATKSGTSMSTPHVSGVATLFLQQARGATPQQVKDAILEQSTKGVINLSLSNNNHMLYSLIQAPKELKGTNPKYSSPCTPKRKREGQC